LNAQSHKTEKDAAIKLSIFFTNHRNYQSSSKTFQIPETNQIKNIQHSSSTHSTNVYGSENWSVKEQDKARITATEMNCFIETAKYTLYGHKGFKIS
jgi:hypothetical protein